MVLIFGLYVDSWLLNLKICRAIICICSKFLESLQFFHLSEIDCYPSSEDIQCQQKMRTACLSQLVLTSTRLRNCQGSMVHSWTAFDEGHQNLWSALWDVEGRTVNTAIQPDSPILKWLLEAYIHTGNSPAWYVAYIHTSNGPAWYFPLFDSTVLHIILFFCLFIMWIDNNIFQSCVHFMLQKEEETFGGLWGWRILVNIEL